ncbi:hypothetical protein C6P40_001640 [Pichia californica]|uniref:Calcineurin-like phosphoesterase domain-containing protein n=1 Tax=Pichia californica TaxID=460514 RepID=A0A9P6WQE9_9ASCO|nr:hypothetical protein C6P42_000037 [[Candida] californica]KAG0691356.1 hypothetical protein C6P40_001640 [[Candida] californica]
MGVLKKVAWTTTYIAIFLNIYIYTYPSLDSQKCYWSHEYRDYDSLSSIEKTIIQLPYFGDLYKQYFVPDNAKKIDNYPRDIRMMAVGDPQLNGNWPNTPLFKKIDNFGNDYYLRHVYQVMKKRLDPNFVSMMGDLVSSQWIGDSEFYNRTRRIIQRSFPRPESQCSFELKYVNDHIDTDWEKYMGEFYDNLNSGKFKERELFEFKDVYDWYNGTFIDPNTKSNTEPLFLNITGNHDIGYGDTTFQHMARWEKLFGLANFWIEYDNDTDHPWRIVMLNSLALDGPMLQPEFQKYTWDFLEALNKTDYHGSTILLTHIPMYKREGLCKDGPNFEYYTASGCHGCVPERVGLLKSQNHLSKDTSRKVLDVVFGKGKSGIILTGHDHYGCDNYINFINEDDGWVADKNITSDKWIREITVRSIMGDFDGTMGIMTGHFNTEEKNWEFDYTQCVFIIQHVWWATQVTTLISILLHSFAFFF